MHKIVKQVREKRNGKKVTVITRERTRDEKQADLEARVAALEAELAALKAQKTKGGGTV